MFIRLSIFPSANALAVTGSLSCFKIPLQLCLIGSLLCFNLSLSAQQPLDAATKAELDELCSEWQDPKQPGIAFGIMQAGELIYTYTAGSTHADGITPITTQTPFNIAELARPVTAYAVLQLVTQGKLSMDADVGEWLKDLPASPYNITVGDLLNHCHGLHDYEWLKPLLGWREGEGLDQREMLQWVSQQATLDYPPGQQFSVGNTTVSLLAKIVSAVTGQPFTTYVEDNVFQPLGMEHTFFADGETPMPASVAMPYNPTDEGFVPQAITASPLGVNMLYSSIEDLARWQQNLQQPTTANAALLQLFHTPIVKADGGHYHVPSGVLTLGQEFLHAERGMENISWLTGYSNGYASGFFRFRDQDLTFISLSNNGLGYNAFLGMQSAYVLLEDQFPDPPVIDYASERTQMPDAATLASYCGDYWNEEGGYVRQISLRNDTLWYVRPEQNRETPMVPVSDDTFLMLVESDDRIEIKFLEDEGQQQMLFIFSGSNPYVSYKIDLVSYEADQLQDYTGLYYCPDLKTSYELCLEDGGLVAKHARNGSIQLRPAMADKFSGDEWWFGNIDFERGTNQQVEGFTLTCLEFQKLRFNRISDNIGMGATLPQAGTNKILFIVSNAHYYGETDMNTANHFAEIVLAYDVFVKEGYTVDFVSPEGGAIPIGYIRSEPIIKRYLYDGAFMNKLEHTLSPDQVNANDYAAVYYGGGGAAMFGVPEDEGIQAISQQVFSNEGVVSAICHGTAGLAHLQQQDGTYLVAGKKVNGFPDQFEDKDAAYYQTFPFSIQEIIQKHGGEFVYSSEGWDGFTAVDGHLITGQDPSAAAKVAQLVVDKLRSEIK